MPSRAGKTALVLSSFLLLGAGQCSDPQAPAVICPHIAQYSNQMQDRALAEYRALPPGSAIKSMFGDYLTLRDQVRACRNYQG
jgi:hypothetical protein